MNLRQAQTPDFAKGKQALQSSPHPQLRPSQERASGASESTRQTLVRSVLNSTLRGQWTTPEGQALLALCLPVFFQCT